MKARGTSALKTILRLSQMGGYLFVFVACASTANPSASPSSTDKVGGFTHEFLGEPVRLTSGSYVSAVNDEANFLEINAAAEEEDARPWFRGTINGIEVDPEPERSCQSDLDEMTDSQRDQFGLSTPTDLPPGTWLLEQSRGTMCEGSPWFIEQAYSLRHGIGFALAKEYNSLELNAEASAQRVSAGIVQGMDAVFVRPIHESGFGNSWIAFKNGSALMILIGVDVRFDDLLAAAESWPL